MQGANTETLGGLEQAVSHFSAGAANLQALLSKLVASVQVERDSLAKARQELDAEKAQLAEEAQKVTHVLSDAEQITLSIGGHKFTTTVTTLRNASGSLFEAMFSGRHNLKRDQEGVIFIDRDGRHFHDILNYLRDGSFNYPADGADFKYLLELRAEAEFYSLCGLVEQIDCYPYALVRVQRSGSLNCEDSWMYEDGPDELVFAVDKPCQLLGVGLAGTEGAYTAELDITQVDPQNFKRELRMLATAAQSFTKSDGTVVRLLLPRPVVLAPDTCYMASVLIKGTESHCCEECLEAVVAAGVRVTFYPYESSNGTNNERGQFPELYIRVITS